MLNKDNIEEILKNLDPSDEEMLAAILDQLMFMGLPQDLLDRLEAILSDFNHKQHSAAKALTIWVFQMANTKIKETKKKKKKKKKSPHVFFGLSAKSGYFCSQMLANNKYAILDFSPDQMILKACLGLAQSYMESKLQCHGHVLSDLQQNPEVVSKLPETNIIGSTADDLCWDGLTLATTSLGSTANFAGQVAGIALDQISLNIINAIVSTLGISPSKSTQPALQLFGM
jgi:hypothetical protein